MDEIISESIDVVCIANYTGINVLKSVRRSQGDPIDGMFFKPLRFKLNEVNGAIILINSDTNDLRPTNGVSGIKQARIQFMSALKYAADLGAKVVVLGASLKRLFGKHFDNKYNIRGGSDGERFLLSEMYPDILFTNGDNGTATILLEEVKDIVSRANFSPGKGGSITVLGGGLLGVESINQLISLGYSDSEIVVISSHSNDIKRVIGQRDIRIYDSLNSIESHTELLICCAHDKPVTADQIDLCGISYVLDVAAPPAFNEDEYLKSRPVYRQDGGNAYSKDLHYEFDPTSIDLGPNEIYGCFAEGTSLALYIKTKGYYYKGENLKSLDWFSVSEKVMSAMSEIFTNAHFSKHPNPLCFGMAVK